MAHQFYVGLSMGRVCAQLRTDLTTSTSREVDRHRPSKTINRVGFDQFRSKSMESNDLKRW